MEQLPESDLDNNCHKDKVNLELNYCTILTLGLSQVTAGKKSAFKIHHKWKNEFLVVSETKIHKVNETKVKIVQYSLQRKSGYILFYNETNSAETIIYFIFWLHI